MESDAKFWLDLFTKYFNKKRVHSGVFDFIVGSTGQTNGESVLNAVVHLEIAEKPSKWDDKYFIKRHQVMGNFIQ